MKSSTYSTAVCIVSLALAPIRGPVLTIFTLRFGVLGVAVWMVSAVDEEAENMPYDMPVLALDAEANASWSLEVPYGFGFDYSEIRWRETADEPLNDWSDRESVVYYDSGTTTHAIEGLTPGGSYKAKVFVGVRGADGRQYYMKSNVVKFTAPGAVATDPQTPVATDPQTPVFVAAPTGATGWQYTFADDEAFQYYEVRWGGGNRPIALGLEQQAEHGHLRPERLVVHHPRAGSGQDVQGQTVHRGTSERRVALHQIRQHHHHRRVAQSLSRPPKAPRVAGLSLSPARGAG